MQNELNGTKMAKMKKSACGEETPMAPNPNAPLWAIINARLNFFSELWRLTETVTHPKNKSWAFWFRPTTPRNGHGSHLYRSIGEGVRNMPARHCFAPSLTIFENRDISKIPLLDGVWKQLVLWLMSVMSVTIACSFQMISLLYFECQII